jgi:hypothetical protein
MFHISGNVAEIGSYFAGNGGNEHRGKTSAHAKL